MKEKRLLYILTYSMFVFSASSTCLSREFTLDVSIKGTEQRGGGFAFGSVNSVLREYEVGYICVYLFFRFAREACLRLLDA